MKHTIEKSGDTLPELLTYVTFVSPLDLVILLDYFCLFFTFDKSLLLSISQSSEIENFIQKLYEQVNKDLCANYLSL